MNTIRYDTIQYDTIRYNTMQCNAGERSIQGKGPGNEVGVPGVLHTARISTVQVNVSVISE